MIIYLTIIPRARVGYEMIANKAHSAQLAIIISYPTSASGIIVLLEKKKRKTKQKQEILQDLTDFAVQRQPEDNLIVTISRPW